MQEPLFSIVTITYNASPTIERTIRSVASQSFNDYEHIIVDGASKDNTLEIIDRVRVRNCELYIPSLTMVYMTP